MSITGDRIRMLRNKNKLSQTELASQLSLGRSNLGHIENGRVDPTKETILKLSEIFDVSTDYLLGRTDSPNSNTSITSTDLDKILDNMMSFDGKPMTERDRETIRAYLEGKFSNK